MLVNAKHLATNWGFLASKLVAIGLLLLLGSYLMNSEGGQRGKRPGRPLPEPRASEATATNSNEASADADADGDGESGWNQTADVRNP